MGELRSIGVVAMGFVFMLVGVYGIYESLRFPWYLFGPEAQLVGTLASVAPVIIGIVLVVAGMRYVREPEAPVPSVAPVPQQVIVREVVTVKVRCSYCGSLYDETLDKCPNCGAKR